MSHRVESPGTGIRYWTPTNFFGSVFLWSFAALLTAGMWGVYQRDGNIWSAVFGLCFAGLLLVVPLCGFYLRHRPAEIRSPQIGSHEGQPALHFPGDRRAVPVSAALWFFIGIATMTPAFRDGWGFASSDLLFYIPGLFFLSYTLFAITGRFGEDGALLHERGVTIRARGLRAELPWSSISGSTTFRRAPWPYSRIAIHLHPGSTRDVSVTVPWWIGSPRPRGDTVYLTKVQIPGFEDVLAETNPGSWISAFTERRLSTTLFHSLNDPPSLQATINRLLYGEDDLPLSL